MSLYRYSVCTSLRSPCHSTYVPQVFSTFFNIHTLNYRKLTVYFGTFTTSNWSLSDICLFPVRLTSPSFFWSLDKKKFFPPRPHRFHPSLFLSNHSVLCSLLSQIPTFSPVTIAYGDFQIILFLILYRYPITPTILTQMVFVKPILFLHLRSDFTQS